MTLAAGVNGTYAGHRDRVGDDGHGRTARRRTVRSHNRQPGNSRRLSRGDALTAICNI